MLEAQSLDRALDALGRVLESRGLSFELVGIGGGGLLLLGILNRPTNDLDIVALVESGEYITARPLPQALRDAAGNVAATLGIPTDWLNAGPADLLDFGLPEGFASRTTVRVYGTLTLHLAGRPDQVFFKLYAATDQGPRSKHFEDLQLLEPTPQELIAAARWAITHDPSDAFRSEIVGALAALGVPNADDLI